MPNGAPNAAPSAFETSPTQKSGLKKTDGITDAQFTAACERRGVYDKACSRFKPSLVELEVGCTVKPGNHVGVKIHP